MSLGEEGLVDMDAIYLARRLRHARERAGMSQADVARVFEVTRPVISFLESGARNVLAVELPRFARLYNVDVMWLLDGGEL